MTITTISAIITAVQDLVGAVTGIRVAPDIPPEQITGSGVFAILTPAEGRYRMIAPGRVEASHTFHLMIATPYTNLNSDYKRVIALGDTVPLALETGGTMAGLIVQITEERYTFGGNIEWGGQTYFGYVWQLDVLVTGSLS